MAGLPKDSANINAIVGELARETNRRMRMGAQFKLELDAYTDLQLTNAGFTAGEVTVLRNAASALLELSNLYGGTATLATVKDFRAIFRPLFGVLGDY